ncbi:TetR/AcrR family transcriptional regulator [Brassicibacter mesophilus]|uniref:TetR/AcrR family transcriptional regulator n=1 Tax=Brassicibacter mesophilus TaxID=745119 RepID=UPI003D19B128
MDKKSLIYKHATELIARHGFENTTIQMIADAGEISVGTVYNYFNNKEAILEYIFQVEYKKREAILKEISEGDVPIETKIRKIVDFQLSELEKNASVVRTIVKESMTKYFYEIEWIQKSVNLIKDAFIKMLAKAKINGEIRDLDEAIVSSLIYFSGYHLAWMNEDKEEDFRKTKEEVFDFIVNGIKK